MCDQCCSSKLVSRRRFFKYALGAGTGLLLARAGLISAEEVIPELEPMPGEFGVPEMDVATPTIYGCSSWGAQAPREPITLLGARPTKIIIHHTASANTTDYTQTQAFNLARSIQQSHFSRGWIDSGQQFTISRGGYIMEGRHRSLEVLNGGTQHVRGAHCDGQNDVAVGIENEGTYTSAEPTTALYSKLISLCAYICQQYSVSNMSIYGHRDFNATACPGDRLYARLPSLRDDVGARLLNWPLVKVGQSGERVKTVQYLLRQHGHMVTADGAFGTGTESAVKSFQSARGLTADGIVGTQTWESLIVTVQNGSSGEAVRAVQSQLASKGYSLTADGLFGSGTESAVRSYESGHRLTSDGIVRLPTWKSMVQ